MNWRVQHWNSSFGLVEAVSGRSSSGSDEAGFLTPAMEASRLVGGLIQRLAASPARDASDALAKLLKDESLSQWHDLLSRAQDEQRVIHRDAGYRHPAIEQIRRTLDGGTSANAGDLAALVMDLIEQLSEQIRTANTDDWRQYWNVDARGRPVTRDPKSRAGTPCFRTCANASRKGSAPNPRGSTPTTSAPTYAYPAETSRCRWKSKGTCTARAGTATYGARCETS